VPVDSTAGDLHVRSVSVKTEFLTRYSRYMELLLHGTKRELYRDLPLARSVLRDGERIATLYSHKGVLKRVSELDQCISS
jgi:hypothetical protein